MSPAFEGSVLAIVKQPGSESEELLGSGIVLSSGLVLSCAHVFDGLEIARFDDHSEPPPEVAVLCGKVAVRPSSIDISRPLDLCCLHFDAIPGAVPVRLARARQLKSGGRNGGMTAVGYRGDQSGPRRNVMSDMKISADQQSDTTGWLQYGQLEGGLPECFSGGPVLARVGDAWVAVGMLQLSGRLAAAAHFIAVDLIAEFLKQHKVNLAIDEFQPEPVPEKPSAPSPAGNHQTQSIVFNGPVNHSDIDAVQKIEKG